MDDGLKSQRDRFMAFAFAVGDLLVEIDREGRIVFAVGAGRPTVGVDTAALAGTEAAELFAEGDRGLVADLAENLAGGERRGPISLRLRPGCGRGAVVANAFRMPGPDRALSLALSPADPASLGRMAGLREADSGLLTMESFIEGATALMRSLGTDRPPLAVTFLTLGDEFAGGTALAEPVAMRIAAILRSRAIAGAATSLGAGRFAAIHAATLAPQRLAAEAAAALGEDAPSEVSGLSLDPGLKPDEAARAIIYGTHEFAAAETAGADLSALAATLARRAGEIVREVGALRRAIEGRDIQIVGMPVVALADHAISRLEFLVRLAPGEAPFSHHLLADRAGPLHQADLVMAECALAYIAATTGQKELRVGIDVAASSLLREDVMSRLTELLSTTHGDMTRLVVELNFHTDVIDLAGLSNAISALARFGVGVALDEFGTSPAPINHLRALQLDEIKLSGQWIRACGRSPCDAALVEAIVGFAAARDMATTAMTVDSLAQAQGLAARGLVNGQGAAFGHPVPIDATKLSMAMAAAGE